MKDCATITAGGPDPSADVYFKFSMARLNALACAAYKKHGLTAMAVHDLSCALNLPENSDAAYMMLKDTIRRAVKHEDHDEAYPQPQSPSIVLTPPKPAGKPRTPWSGNGTPADRNDDGGQSANASDEAGKAMPPSSAETETPKQRAARERAAAKAEKAARMRKLRQELAEKSKQFGKPKGGQAAWINTDIVRLESSFTRQSGLIISNKFFRKLTGGKSVKAD